MTALQLISAPLLESSGTGNYLVCWIGKGGQIAGVTRFLHVKSFRVFPLEIPQADCLSETTS